MRDVEKFHGEFDRIDVFLEGSEGIMSLAWEEISIKFLLIDLKRKLKGYKVFVTKEKN